MTNWTLRGRNFPPGVRRMQALMGQQAAFAHGREQLKALAGLEVSTKSVERRSRPYLHDYRKTLELKGFLGKREEIAYGKPYLMCQPVFQHY